MDFLRFLFRFILPGLVVVTARLGAAEVPQSGQPSGSAISGQAARLARLIPELDRTWSAFREEQHIPGLVYGLMVDGRLAHTQAFGLADLGAHRPVKSDTRFRIASMTKSVVAMAILKLRDEGRLGLDDPVEKYLPQFRASALLTTDSAPVTLRALLTMNAGLPEDNPWGDRQLAMSEAEFDQLLAAGFSFSRPTYDRFEYSNLGYMVLGRVIRVVTGLSYQEYVTRNILTPLDMAQTVWDFKDVPAGELALGYRWTGDSWQTEPMLHDGAGAACGGLITTIEDFGHYVAFLAQAWPARDGPESGPVRRATLREMQEPRVFSNLSATGPVVRFYSYGLNWGRDLGGAVTLGHAGGLPGYGSGYAFRPGLGLAVIVFANLKNAKVYPVAQAVLQAAAAQVDSVSRPPTTSAVLVQRSRQLQQWLQSRQPELGDEFLASNFFLDHPRVEWSEQTQTLLRRVGPIVRATPVIPENALRGSFTLVGAAGIIKVSFSLTAEKIPRIQAVRLDWVEGDHAPH